MFHGAGTHAELVVTLPDSAYQKGCQLVDAVVQLAFSLNFLGAGFQVGIENLSSFGLYVGHFETPVRFSSTLLTHCRFTCHASCLHNHSSIQGNLSGNPLGVVGLYEVIQGKILPVHSCSGV